ncbi:MAG: hypothetical protein [Olavius algarvensis Delta 4 endosymbiont]|nr:MAG: hypothetical protein [Olavius algarvensis Delta 4 endosymbiont]
MPYNFGKLIPIPTAAQSGCLPSATEGAANTGGLQSKETFTPE